MLWTPEVVPEQLAGLAGARTFPLRSSFAPEYNMAVNLLGRMGLSGARSSLHRSFAQFQADRSVVGQAASSTTRGCGCARPTRNCRKLAAERGRRSGRHRSRRVVFSYIDLREDIRRREQGSKFHRRGGEQHSRSSTIWVP